MKALTYKGVKTFSEFSPNIAGKCEVFSGFSSDKDLYKDRGNVFEELVQFGARI